LTGAAKDAFPFSPFLEFCYQLDLHHHLGLGVIYFKGLSKAQVVPEDYSPHRFKSPMEGFPSVFFRSCQGLYHKGNQGLS
jgi:hypothetical protein